MNIIKQGSLIEIHTDTKNTKRFLAPKRNSATPSNLYKNAFLSHKSVVLTLEDGSVWSGAERLMKRTKVLCGNKIGYIILKHKDRIIG